MRYGEGCKLFCICNNKNILLCDLEMGECICKLGFIGYFCNCFVGLYICNIEIFDCYKENN